MDSSNNNDIAPRRVLGTTSGRVIFKNISVSAIPPPTAMDSRDSRPSFLGALKPSFEKTLHFARELTAFGRDRDSSPASSAAMLRSRFGSTPVIPDKPPTASSRRSPPYGGVLRSESGSRSLVQPDREERRRHCHALSASEAQLPQLPGADRGRKYALVQLDSTAQRSNDRGKVRRDGVDVLHRAVSIEDGLGMLATETNGLISCAPIIDEVNSSSTTLTSLGTASNFTVVPRASRYRHRYDPASANKDSGGSQHQLSSDAESGVVYTARRCYSTVTDLDSHTGDSDIDAIEAADAYIMRHKSADRSSSRETAPRGFIDRKHRRQSVAASLINSNPPEMGNTVSVRRVTQTSASQTTLEPGSRRYSRSYHALPSAMQTSSPHDSGHSDGTATTTSNDTTPSNSGTPVMRRRPQDLHPTSANPWVEIPGHTIQTTTTFGTTPSRHGSTYMIAENAFTPDDEGLDRGFANQPVLPEQQAWDTQSTDYSHMAPTATSSSSSMMPSLYPANNVNKVAVAPQPQKKSSSSTRHSRQAFDDSMHRHSVRHSHGTPIASSTPNQLALRNPNRVSRVSNEVYIDGPPPCSPVVDASYRYSSAAWDERTREQYEAQKKLLIDKDLNIARLEGRMIQMTKDMSAKECECENIKKSKDSIERAYKDTKREADNYADRLACCQKSNAQLRKESEEDRVKFQRELEEKIALIEKLQSGDAEKSLRSSLEDATKRNATLQDEILLKSRRITELEAANAELQRRLDAVAAQKASRRHSASTFKEEGNGFETLTEADTGDELWVSTSFRADNNRTPTMPRSASSNTSLNASVHLPANFETLLRSHYRKTMGIDSLASALSQVVADMFSGKTAEAARTLGAYTDTEGEESEAFVSEAPDASAKISIGNAERYLRKENDMLDRAEKRLLDIRAMYSEAVRKGVPLKR